MNADTFCLWLTAYLNGLPRGSLSIGERDAIYAQLCRVSTPLKLTLLNPDASLDGWQPAEVVEAIERQRAEARLP